MDDEFKRSVSETRDLLLEKLMQLVNGKTSQGVTDYFGVVKVPKGQKFTHKLLQGIDFLDITPNKWTSDKDRMRS